MATMCHFLAKDTPELSVGKTLNCLLCMARQGCHPAGNFVAAPLTGPSLLDLPSTSGSHTPEKLPLYGSLDIRDYDDFLREQKVIFQERYEQPCAKIENLDEYQYLYILGRGDFSKTVVARRKSEHYALKIYVKHLLVKNNLVQKVLQEKRILQSLDCPFCIRLEYFFQDTFELIFVLPFVSGGEIFTHLQRNSKFDENMSKFYAGQVVLALEYLHHCNVVYRELKPETLILDHLGYLKISDFSSAKVVTSRTYTFCGTPEYVAPEMIAGKGYGKSVDWWAFGVLLFEMNAGHPPFISPNRVTTFQNITAARYSSPSSVSRDLQDLIKKLLQPDVSKRAGNLEKSPEDIKNHKWFKGMIWLELANRHVAPPFVPGRIKSSVNYPTLASSSAHDLQAENVDEHFKDF